jgi:hypothetical protein
MNHTENDPTMTDATTRTSVPTGIDALAELLGATPPDEWDAIHARLASQLGDKDEAWKIHFNAVSQVEHDEEIARLRAELREALAAAEAGVLRVTGVVNELASHTVYDVEYAEGAHAHDMRAFLLDAGRMIRAATALNPCPT